jgi:ABC-type phosphate/phosphonate transport system substrate-binding protein
MATILSSELVFLQAARVFFMLATLPMYDWPEIRSSTDAFWQALAGQLGVAAELDREADYHVAWHRPDLLFSQTCGYPFTHTYKGQFCYVATPHYAADGCEGPAYCSILFARESGPLSTFANTRPAINTPDSMSGMLALKVVMKGIPLAREILTGSHVQSMEAVQEGAADICAIDAVCVALASTHRPHLLKGLVEIARSTMVPGLPFVTRMGDPESIRAALRKVFADPETAFARRALLLEGFSVLPANVYDVIPALEATL